MGLQVHKIPDRSFLEVVVVVGTLMNDFFLARLFLVLQQILYRSPETEPDSWMDLCNLVTEYFGILKIADLCVDDFPEREKLLARILSNRINHQRYLRLKPVPAITDLDDFYEVIELNRELLDGSV